MTESGRIRSLEEEDRSRMELDAICRRFERARRERNDILIESFLDLVPAMFRVELAEELVAIECDLRSSAGEIPVAEDYRQRFPEIADQLPRILNEISCGSTDDAATAPRFDSLGEFQIVRQIGRGGMGIVYEAVQVSLGRRVALKVLPESGQFKLGARERFLLESRVVASLRHPHIVHAFSAGEQGGFLYLAMELIDGQSLSQVYRSARHETDNVDCGTSHEAKDDPNVNILGQQRNAEWFQRLSLIGADIADALSYAHGKGILHRDVKPSNVLVDSTGRSFLTDFGLAKLAADEQDLTQTGDVLGTLRYTAPEVFAGHYDACSDVYSWGLSLFELASLEPTFGVTTRAELIKQITSNQSPLRRFGNRGIPDPLFAILARATEVDPARRYASAADFAADLSRFANGQVPFAHRDLLHRRRRRFLISSSSAVVAFGLGAWILKLRAAAHAADDDSTTSEPSAQTDASNVAKAPDGESSEQPQYPSAARQVLQLTHAAGVPVRAVAISPDSSMLLTGGDDGAIRTWNATSGAPLRVLATSRGCVRHLCVSDDGKWLGIVSGDSSDATATRIEAWNFESGRNYPSTFGICRLGWGPFEEQNRPRFFRIGPNSNTLLCYLGEKTPVLWDFKMGSRLILPTDQSPVRYEFVEAYSDVDRVIQVLAVGNSDGIVTLSGLGRLAKQMEVQAEVGKLRSLKFGPRGMLACSGEQGVSFLSLHVKIPFKLQFPPRADASVELIAFTSQEQFLAVATKTTCRVFDVAERVWLGDGFALEEELHLLAWNRAEHALLMVTKSGQIQIRDRQTGRILAATTHRNTGALEFEWIWEKSTLLCTDNSGTVTIYRIAEELNTL